MVLEHEEITEKIIGAAFEVHKVLGYGFLEKVYQKAMQVELKVAEKYNSKDEAQLINELKATGIRVGLLINFGKEKVEFKRIVYSQKSAFHPRQSAAKTKPKAQADGGANSVPLRSTE